MSDTLEKNTNYLTEQELVNNFNSAIKNVNVTPPNLPGATWLPSGGTVTISASGGGGGGSGLYTVSGSNGTSWTPNTSYSISSLSNATLNSTSNVTRITAPLEVNGRDILKELDEMRDALLLLKRDVKMEEKYPKLKELKDAYERALEKYKTFDAIKDSK